MLVVKKNEILSQYFCTFKLRILLSHLKYLIVPDTPISNLNLDNMINEIFVNHLRLNNILIKSYLIM